MALVGRTSADVRDVMVEGESGILACAPPTNRPRYEPSKRRLTWPNGAQATTYSGDEPDLLRGPQHDAAWADELAAWRYPEAWDQLQFGLRLGTDPRVVVTTTPRATPLIKNLLAAPTTRTTRGSTRENAANLAPAFLSQIVARFEGTRLGRQELDGAILDDNPGALWQRENIEATRLFQAPALFSRVIVGVDPQVADPAQTTDEQTAETGIIVAGVAGSGTQARGYVLDDRSVRASPQGWASAVIAAYTKNKADRIIAEANNGGAMVEAVIATAAKDAGLRVPVTLVHASRGKAIRAEPVAALYEQGRISHVGAFPELEDQLCSWEPGQKSPDRMDALVWAFTHLMVTTDERPSVPLRRDKYA